MCREQDWVVLGTKGDQLRRGGLNINLHNAVAKTHAVNLFYRNKTEPEEAYKDEGSKYLLLFLDKIHNQGQSIASGLRAMDEEERVKFFVDRYFTKQK
jgi:hypothetical protein